MHKNTGDGTVFMRTKSALQPNGVCQYTRLSAVAPFIEAGPLCNVPTKKCIKVRFVDGDLVHISGHDAVCEGECRRQRRRRWPKTPDSARLAM